MERLSIGTVLIDNLMKGMYKYMIQLIIKFIVTLVILSGVILIYDARTITKKHFGFGDQNEATDGLKIIGYVLAIVGALILFFNR